MVRTPPSTRTDEELVDAARRGERDAFVELYERYFPSVFDFSARITRDRDDAADVAQETFVRALERLDTLQDGRRFKSWVFTIARNETLDRLRRSKRVRPLRLVDDEGNEDAMDVVDVDRFSEPSEAAEANATAALVWEAAAGLDPRQQSILDLHLRQGLNSAEIAEVLGVSKNNGYVMLNRLKAAVQSTIESFVLFRQARGTCRELDAVLGTAETETMSPEIRRAIGRHAADCEGCDARKRRLLAPLAVLGGLAPVMPGTVVSEAVLDRLLEVYDALAIGGSLAAEADVEDDAPPETPTGLGGLVALETDEPSTLAQLDDDHSRPRFGANLDRLVGEANGPDNDEFDPSELEFDPEY